MLITPDAEELTTTLPDIVAQSARALASACELMVAVAWEQMADVWAGERLSASFLEIVFSTCIFVFQPFLLCNRPLVLSDHRKGCSILVL